MAAGAANEHELNSIIIDTVATLVVVADREGRIVRFNQACERTLGYERAGVIGRLVWEVFPPAEFRDRTRVRTLRLASTAPGESEEFDAVWLTRNREPRHISFHCRTAASSENPGVVQYIIGTGTDVTERLREQEALRQSEERFRMTVMHSPDMMFHQDLDLRLTWVSRVLAPGYVPEDMVGLTDTDFVGPDEARRLRAVKMRVLQTGVGERFETVARFQNTVLYLETAVERRVDASGKVLGIVGYVRDVSERKRVEQELRALNAQLKSLNETLEQQVRERTADLEQRALDLARSEQSLRESERHFKEVAESNQRLVRELEHRVRNNLAGLLGLVTAMRDRAPDVKSFAEAIEGRLHAMAHVYQLLAASGWEAVSLETLIQSAIAAMQSLAMHRPVLEIGGPDVLVTSTQVLPLTLIVIEWFTNSCKYGVHSKPGGHLAVRWEWIGSDRVQLRWRETGGPPIERVPRPSLGSELVRGFAHNELKGEVRLSYPPAGVDHVLEFTVRSGGC